MATMNTWPNNRNGNNPEKLRIAKPPAVLIAAPSIARPVVAVVFEVHSATDFSG